MLVCNSTFATKLAKKMDARLKFGLAFWFTVMSCMAVRPPYHLHHALPNATDNDSTQADKARNTLPRVVNLKEVNVLAPRQLTQPTVAQALNEQRLIAGSTSLVQMSPLRQRLSTLKDALAMQPGVIIQEFFGLNDQPRLNIRGSGIQSNPQRRGVYLLQDGIPVNFADGSYIIGVMDPMTAHFVEVFKGANALNFGASTLGGAINFVSPTANKKHGANMLVKAEGGSYGYRAVAASMGYRWQTSDAHISTSYSAQDGHRLYNHNTRWSIAANYGLQNLNGHVENRTYLHFTWLKFQFPGPLNMQQLMDNPKQVNAGVDLPFSMGPNVLRDKPRRFARMIRVANRTGIRFNANSDLVAAVYYQYADDQFVFPITISIPHSYHHDGGLTLNYRLTTGKHNLRAGLVASAGQIDRLYQQRRARIVYVCPRQSASTQPDPLCRRLDQTDVETEFRGRCPPCVQRAQQQRPLSTARPSAVVQPHVQKVPLLSFAKHNAQPALFGLQSTHRTDIQSL